MRVVISGYYGFDNVGDDAILLSIIQALKSEDPTIGITVLSNQPIKTKTIYGVDAVDRWNLKQVTGAIKQSDGLISGGGSLLQDETGFKSIPYYAGIMKIAQFLRKPVFVYAQGMGPINKKINKIIVKQVLKRTSVTVRDQASMDLLRNIGIRNEIRIVPDPVLGVQLSSRQSNWWDQQSFHTPVITVSVREWPSTVEYKKKIAKSLDAAAKSGKVIVFVPMHGEHDYQTSKEVANHMLMPSVIAPHDISIEEKIIIIGKSNLLVGMRLHALIFSAVMETPFIAISYDPKIDAFAEISGQPIVGHVNKNDWNEDSLFNGIQSMFKREKEEMNNMIKKINPLIQEARTTAIDTINYFKQYNK